MLVRLGERRPSSDLVDLLLECHERIRRFTAMAAQLAVTDAPAAEVRDAGWQIRRYFVESFPLHLADEDEQLAPRLTGTSPELDAALVQMTAEHATHAPIVARVTAVCSTLEREPSHRAALAGELAEAAAALAASMEPHLALEERVVFPAVRRLADGERDAIRSALRDRRDRALRER